MTYLINKNTENEETSNLSSTPRSAGNHGSQLLKGKISLVIERIKFTSNELNDVETWVKGNPEVRIVLAHSTVDGTHANKMHNAVYEPSHRSDIEDCWWNCGILLSASWNLSSSGSCLKIFFAEDDVINITKYT